MSDTYSKAIRSRVMAGIRSQGNKSTEQKLQMTLVKAGISGWQIHPRNVVGKPDFIFQKDKLAIFVDGCFWHGCPICYVRPKSNRHYWDAKVAGNKERDKKLRAKMRQEGWHVYRIWEHQLSNPEKVLDQIRRKLRSHFTSTT